MTVDLLRRAAAQMRERAQVGTSWLLAVARWLDVAALHWDDGSMCCDNGPDYCEIAGPALAVARAYLGEPA